ncbi:MAG: hypothetical protein ACR2GR_09715 [Rhodothermales bacterium]
MKGSLYRSGRRCAGLRTSGPGLFDMMAVLGKDVCLRRLRRAVEVLG